MTTARRALNAVFVLTYPLVLALTPASGETIYVKADASGANDGTSWLDAHVNLQDALAHTVAGDELWVAAGTYKPDRGQTQTPGDREASFVLIAGAALYGGFAGDEATLTERAGLFDQTILSGDLAGNDDPNFVNYEENSHHIVSHDAETEDPCILDGFQIAAGNADDPNSAHAHDGAGIRFQSGVLECKNCTIVKNTAVRNGGGVFLGRYAWWDYTAIAHFEQCAFVDNRATREGGALSGIYAGATPTFRNCDFDDNAASAGGAVHSGGVDASYCGFTANRAPKGGAIYSFCPSLSDCTFANNVAEYHGTGYGFYGGGAVMLAHSCGTIKRCVFTGNSAIVTDGAPGGGGALISGNINAYTQVIECTFINNSSSRDGGAVLFSNLGRPSFFNCTFVGNVANGVGNRFGGGAIYSANRHLKAVNCVFLANQATDTSPWSGGGAILCDFFDGAQISNCIFAGNSAGGRGGGLLSTASGAAQVSNSMFLDNTSGYTVGGQAQINAEDGTENTVAYCCIEGWTPDLGDAGNFDADPMFVDPLGPDGVAWTGDEDLRLTAGSPCIDRGVNWAIPEDAQDIDDDGDVTELIPIDFVGAPRFQNDPNTPDNACAGTALIDIGPYETAGVDVPPCLGDFNTDGVINIWDLSCILPIYGAHHSDPGFNPACDLTMSGEIDIGDLAHLLSVYGASCP